MKNLILFLAMMLTALVTASCASQKNDTREVDVKAAEEQALIEKYHCIILSPDAEEIAVYFKAGESPYFDIYSVNKDSRAVYVVFFNSGDVDGSGYAKEGVMPCRIYTIFLPEDERLRGCGYYGIITARDDGSEHAMPLRLIDQPSE